MSGFFYSRSQDMSGFLSLVVSIHVRSPWQRVAFMEWSGRLNSKLDFSSMGVDVLIKPQSLRTFVVPPFKILKVQGPLTMWPVKPDFESWWEDKFKGKWIGDDPTMWMCTLHNCLPLLMEVPWEHVRPLMGRSICRRRKNARHPLAWMFILIRAIWLNIIVETTMPFSIVRL